MRRWMLVLACALAFLFSTGSVFAQKKPNKPAEPVKPAPKPQPPKKAKFRRVVHAIELSATKKFRFSGKLTLKVAAPHTGPNIDYYWGGKCKGSKLSGTRLTALYVAMREGWSVEVPSRPMKYEGRVHMCVRAVRIIKE